MRIVDKDMNQPQHVAEEILKAWTGRLQHIHKYANPY